MKKACFSLIFMSALAYATPELKELTNKAPTHINVLEYLKAKRPVEQDYHRRYTIPTFLPSGGKQFEVNWSQVGNIAGMFACGITNYNAGLKNYNAGLKPNEFQPSQQPDRWLNDQLKSSRIKGIREAYDRFFLMRIVAGLCTLGFGYKWWSGEQKNPFRIIDEPETVPTEESDQ